MKQNIPVPPPPNGTARALRETLLRNAPRVLDMYIRAAVGDNSFSNLIEPEATREVWEVVKKIILATSDTDKITATSTQEVIKLLSKGAININEAIKLMQMLQHKQEIEELPRLREQLEQIQLHR